MLEYQKCNFGSDEMTEGMHRIASSDSPTSNGNSGYCSFLVRYVIMVKSIAMLKLQLHGKMHSCVDAGPHAILKKVHPAVALKLKLAQNSRRRSLS